MLVEVLSKLQICNSNIGRSGRTEFTTKTRMNALPRYTRHTTAGPFTVTLKPLKSEALLQLIRFFVN